MSPARQLYELQRLELENNEARNTILLLESQLADTRQIDQAKGSLETASQKLGNIHLQQKRTELDIGEYEDRLRITEERLYAGKTANPKELLGLQDEISSLRIKKQQAEDQFLDLMLQTEQTEIDISNANANLGTVQSKQIEEHEGLLAKREHLTEQLAVQEHHQDTIRSTIPATELAVYESLKTSKGNAISQVEHGICRGCGLTIPSRELQRVRYASDIVRCNSCSRILYIV